MDQLLDRRRRDIDFILKVTAELKAAASFDELQQPLEGLCRYFDLDGFTWFFMADRDEIFELDTRPGEWKQRYEKGLYLFNDPIVQTAAATDQPFIWEDALLVRQLSGKQRSIMNGARDYGIQEGFNFPIHDVDISKGSLSFYHEDLNHVREVWAEYGDFLSHVSFLCHVRSKGLIRPKPDALYNEPILTAGEREVIQMMAEGMRIPEISDRLHLSESGIRKRFREAFRKLGVRTSGQATAVALMRGEIHPFDIG